MHQQAFGDNLACCHARGQRAKGVLQHDLNLLAQRPHLFLVQLGNVPSFKGDCPFAGQEPQQGAGKG